MEKKITFAGLLTNGFQIGLKNIGSIIGALVLWIITIWVPYINIGTTIAISTLPIQMAKGETFSPLSIFDKKYRQFMGEYFILCGLIYIAILIGLFLFIVPGIVLSVSWTLAVYFLLDKHVNPMEALMASNKATNGYKWPIFLSGAVIGVAGGILTAIFGLIPFIGWIFNLVILLLIMAITMGMSAYAYRELSK